MTKVAQDSQVTQVAKGSEGSKGSCSEKIVTFSLSKNLLLWNILLCSSNDAMDTEPLHAGFIAMFFLLRHRYRTLAYPLHNHDFLTKALRQNLYIHASLPCFSDLAIATEPSMHTRKA